MAIMREVKNPRRCPGQGAQLVGALSHTPKEFRFKPGLGHIPRLWV